MGVSGSASTVVAVVGAPSSIPSSLPEIAVRNMSPHVSSLANASRAQVCVRRFLRFVVVSGLSRLDNDFMLLLMLLMRLLLMRLLLMLVLMLL